MNYPRMLPEKSTGEGSKRPGRSMELIPLDDELVTLAAGWLSEKQNYQWLDFGNGVQHINAVSLKIMAQKPIHLVRLFTSDDGTGKPIGIVALSNIDRVFKTATMWAVLGVRSQASRGHATHAVSMMLAEGFQKLGLQAINVWAAECNAASLGIVRKLRFTPIGRQRRCHYIDGRAFDRLWFDMLAEEYSEEGHV